MSTPKPLCLYIWLVQHRTFTINKSYFALLLAVAVSQGPACSWFDHSCIGVQRHSVLVRCTLSEEIRTGCTCLTTSRKNGRYFLPKPQQKLFFLKLIKNKFKKK